MLAREGDGVTRSGTMMTVSVAQYFYFANREVLSQIGECTRPMLTHATYTYPPRRVGRRRAGYALTAFGLATLHRTESPAG